MANHKSSEKRVRQTLKRNEVNRSNRSRLRTQIKKLRSAITSADKATMHKGDAGYDPQFPLGFGLSY